MTADVRCDVSYALRSYVSCETLLQGAVNSKSRTAQKPATLARLTRLPAGMRLVDRRKQRDVLTIAAVHRINARRGGGAAPKLPPPRAYPLQDDVDWASCNESDDDQEDEARVFGPSIQLDRVEGAQIDRIGASSRAAGSGAASRSAPSTARPTAPAVAPAVEPVASVSAAGRPRATRVVHDV
jgi:hypothetical protein